jgi:hypothetical protein
VGVALWSNLHAGAFVAPIALALAAVGARLERNGAATRIALTALGAAAAVLATPIGFGLFRYLRLHLTLPALHPVDEFRAPTWLSDPALFLFAAALVVVAVAALAASRDGGPRRRVPWTLVLPVLVFAALAVRSVRFAADGALVAAPLLAAALTALGDRLRARRPSWWLSDPIPSVAATALIAGITLGPRLGGRGGGGIDLEAREVPLAAIAFVNANGLRDRRADTRRIACSSIRGSPPIRPSSTGCSAAPT